MFEYGNIVFIYAFKIMKSKGEKSFFSMNVYYMYRNRTYKMYVYTSTSLNIYKTLNIKYYVRFEYLYTLKKHVNILGKKVIQSLCHEIFCFIACLNGCNQ